MDGWIKIHRKLLDWEWYDDGNVVRVFLHLLLTANFEPKNWHGITIERGQLATSVVNLASQVHLTSKQIRIVLEKLKNTNEIDIQTTNKYTLITISKYADYQTQETAIGQTNGNQRANEGQTEGNQRATTKEIKNDNKERIEEDYDCADKSAQNKKPTKKQKTAIDIEPIISELPSEIQSIARMWVDYKKQQFGFSYKSEKSFEFWLKDLYKKSNGDVEAMKAIVENSIANGYQGIFELKKNYNYGNRNDVGYIPTERIVAAGFAMAEAGL